MKFRLLALIMTGLFGLALIQPAARAEEDVQDGVEVQARGQIHEAYAEAAAAKAAPGVVVSKEPPQAIEETPPEEKPEGDNVAWIPGYWAWDEEGSEFIWISGFWRVVPPARAWTAGHWQRVTTGFQWVSGYWGEIQSGDQAPISVEQEYLPAPPETLDAGPSTPAPAEDYNYVPGIWVYQMTKYVWRPGYWVRYRPSWVWVPACYKWTPYGYLFVTGYWDAPLCDRGLLFAPVRFSRAVYLRRGFVYRPAYVVQPDFLIGSLFVRSTTRTYYFGNYFEAGYRRRYVPWVDYRISRNTYDVNFNYYRTAYVKHGVWEKNLRTLYTGRYAGEIARPPVTLVQQTKVINTYAGNKTANVVIHKNVAITNVQNATVLTPVNKVSTMRVTALAPLAGIKVAEIKTAPVNRTVTVQKISVKQVQEERRHAERIAVISRERKAAELKAVATLPKDGKLATPVRMKVDLPKTTPAPRAFKAPTTLPPAPVKIKTEFKSSVTPPPVKRDGPPPVKKDGPPPVKKDGPPPVKKDGPPARKDGPPAKTGGQFAKDVAPVVKKDTAPVVVKKDVPPVVVNKTYQAPVTQPVKKDVTPVVVSKTDMTRTTTPPTTVSGGRYVPPTTRSSQTTPPPGGGNPGNNRRNG